MHCVPLHAGWDGADRLTELSAQLQSALADGTSVTGTGLDTFRRELGGATAAAGQATPPLVDLLLAHLALDADEPTIAAEHRAALDSIGAADIVPAELAARRSARSARRRDRRRRHDSAVSRPLGRRARSDGRRANPAEFNRRHPRCSRRGSHPRSGSGGRPARWLRHSSLRSATIRAAIGQLARASVSIEALERIRSSATDDAGLHRLLTHVIDDAHIRQMQPADIVSNTELPALIAATGMPAAALTRAAARTGLLWRRRRLIRRLTVGALVAALVLVAAFVVWTLFGGDSAVHAEDDRAAAVPGELIVVDVLANDSGGQGGLFITEVTPPTQGSIGLAGNGITYTAEPGASGVDSFGYQITDGGGSREGHGVRRHRRHRNDVDHHHHNVEHVDVDRGARQPVAARRRRRGDGQRGRTAHDRRVGQRFGSRR